MKSRALLAGVNKYRMEGCDLQGCVNDVTNVRDVLLKHFGFAVGDIRVIVDERATKKAIVDRLGWLVKGARKGDRLLFHFSGHGSQIRDRDGDELKDHLDEILCPHDMDWDGTFVTDDTLSEIFGDLPKGINLEVLLDCCHSGTGTRQVFAAEGLPRELSFKPRFIEPPVDILCRLEDDLPVRRIVRPSNPLRGVATEMAEGHVLFSGCRANQTSADAMIGGHYNGAFTYYFCKHLRDTKGQAVRSDLLKRVRASLKFNGFDQVPQLECVKPEQKNILLG
jgi:metacaspase-1